MGLDVHSETIAAGLVEGSGEERFLGTVPNRPESVRKLMKRLGVPAKLRVCYEAGPTGYGLYWLLTGMGIDCQVVAPTLVPTKPGDRVKTDRGPDRSVPYQVSVRVTDDHLVLRRGWAETESQTRLLG